MRNALGKVPLAVPQGEPTDSRRDDNKIAVAPNSMTASPVLRALLSRSSVAPKTLVAPGPSQDELALAVSAALTAPDHGGLRPWRLVAIAGDGRHQLARIFMQVRKLRDPRIGTEELNRTWRKTMRGPALVAVIGRFVENHPKAPVHEQLFSTGAAVHAFLQALHVMGYGAIMLSGRRANHQLVRDLLKIGSNEQVLGFVSIGTPSKPVPPKTRPDPSGYISYLIGQERDARTLGTTPNRPRPH